MNIVAYVLHIICVYCECVWRCGVCDMYGHTNTYVCRCVHSYKHTWIHIYILTIIHTSIHTHTIHAHIHTYMHHIYMHAQIFHANMNTCMNLLNRVTQILMDTYIHTCGWHINIYAYVHAFHSCMEPHTHSHNTS